MAGALNLYSIPPSAGFLPALVDGIAARIDIAADPFALADATIYLPTRRAVRTFSDALAERLGGAVLLPQIRPLGDVDEDDFQIDGDSLLTVPPIGRTRREFLLATLIRQWHSQRDSGELGFAQAVRLARSLGSFLDEMQTQSVDLSRLDDLVSDAFAEHWQQTHDFLTLLAKHWPAILAEDGAEDRVIHRDAALRRLAQRYLETPPQGWVIAAGSTGSIPATAELLAAIAHLPRGAVILPGLDRALDEESWRTVDPTHPQYGMQQLLARIGAKRAQVRDWQDAKPANAAREALLRETLRPAPTTDAWRKLADEGGSGVREGLNGLSVLEAADSAEEAAAIAALLREVLETPEQTAAFVTPDRALARRVAAELGRWNIAIDDSAGVPLAHTPPGAFLCLLAEAAEQQFAPVALLALLKHPLCAAGEERGLFLRRVRQLDRALRGLTPDPGLDGIANKIAGKQDLLRWFARLTQQLQPLADPLSHGAALSDIVAAHSAVAEELARTADDSGAARLWRGQDGRTAADFLADLSLSATGLPATGEGYAALFRNLAEQIPVRPPYARHPRLAILGAQEARLQSFDLVVLGGLNEGSWPVAAANDPWLSRPMRKTLGLEQPERAIGLAALDFATLAASPRAVLTRARKADGAPTVPSRWLQRLTQLAQGLGLGESLPVQQTYIEWANRLVTPKEIVPASPPRPTPKASARPRKLSVTEIETWVRDPYAIYARHVLGLRVLDPLDMPIGPMERGSAIHQILERFVLAYPHDLPDDAVTKLCAIADQVFAEKNTPEDALALWRPRFARAALQFVAQERERRQSIAQSFTEQKADFAVTPDFTLRGVADRIDILNGGSAAIIDYKTGTPPTNKQIENFLAPQLLLEAAMLEAGAFKDAGERQANRLAYVQFSGGRDPDKLQEVDTALIPEILERLRVRIAQFADPTTPYLSRVCAFSKDSVGDYDHLARVQEWSLGGAEVEE